MNNTSRIALAAALALTGGYAAAAPMPNVFDDGNRWLITAYNDASPVHTTMATQGICFLPYAVVGTHVRGYWYSDTFPDWNGVYSQEGDQVFMHGDYAANVGHDGITFEIDTSSVANEGSGHWAEWRENTGYGRTIVFANTKLRRVGKCNTILAADALKLPVPPRLLDSGAQAQSPLDMGQVPIPGIEILR